LKAGAFGFWSMKLPALAVALPGTLLVLATTALLLGLPFGFDPLWHAESLTLPEAAALRDTGEVVRLIANRENPDAPGPVRANILRSEPVVVTPLEAAVAADRPEVIEVLLDQGASLDAPTMVRLVCFARRVEADDAGAFLLAQRPDDAPGSCDQVSTPW
jgi:hypothetical protein